MFAFDSLCWVPFGFITMLRRSYSHCLCETKAYKKPFFSVTTYFLTLTTFFRHFFFNGSAKSDRCLCFSCISTFLIYIKKRQGKSHFFSTSLFPMTISLSLLKPCGGKHTSHNGQPEPFKVFCVLDHKAEHLKTFSQPLQVITSPHTHK